VDRTVSAVNIDALVGNGQVPAPQVDSIGNRLFIWQTETELATVLDQAEQKVFSITQERPQQVWFSF